VKLQVRGNAVRREEKTATEEERGREGEAKRQKTGAWQQPAESCRGYQGTEFECAEWYQWQGYQCRR